MKSNILYFLKGLLGIALFIGIQLLTSFIFQDQLINGSYLTKNIILIGSELTSLIIFILINFKTIKKDFIDFDVNFKSYLKLGFKNWIIGLIIMIISNLLITSILNIVPANETNNREIISQFPIYSVIAISLIAPMVEELVFRCNFKKMTNNNYIFIIVTSLLFAGIHVINGFTSIKDLLFLIPYGSLAVAFGITYTKTDNIFTTVIIHTIHNTMSLIIIGLSAFILGVLYV